MNKIALIIQREYLTRVRKRSFIIMTILGPILMAAIIIVPIYVAQIQGKIKKVAVLDETGLFFNKFRNSENLLFDHVYSDVESSKHNLTKNGFYGLLYIPRTNLSVPTSAVFYSDKQPNILVKTYIQEVMKKEIESMKLAASGIDQNVLESIKTKVSLTTIKLDEGGKEEKSFTEVSMVLGLFSGILIYFFIFLFGSQVMRGVIEEKTSRIVEIIVSSVKPFQLMMGKIIGVGMVGLTQFLLWILLTAGLIFIAASVFDVKLETQASKQMMIQQATTQYSGIQADTNLNSEKDEVIHKIFEGLASINFVLMIGSFIFFFLGGYLMYAALFAAIGAAVDNETDTQQFMLPITIPLIFSIVMAQYVINNPEGPAAFWLSVIPLTSPVIMMIRIPFGVPFTELCLSVVLLIAGFFAATWLAAKVYRTGILMYGKKVDYKELWKWITY